MNETNTAQVTELAAKIAARNNVHRLIVEWTPKLRAALVCFVGKKVQKAGSHLAERAKEALEAAIPERFRNGKQCRERIYVRGSRGCIRAEFNTGVGWAEAGGGDEGWHPVSEKVYLADVDARGFMIDLHKFDPANYRTDYTAVEVSRARAQLDAAESAYEEAKGNPAIQLFGRHEVC